MLSLFIGKDAAEVKIFKFPAGESGVSFTHKNSTYIGGTLAGMITLKWESNEDIINLALLVDAVRREYREIELSLEIPYFPYARQDRVCNKGESLSVKVIANIINSLGFARVYVTDPHSEVLGAVLDNMIEVHTKDAVSVAVALCWNHRTFATSAALVSPDAGALKKTFKYAKYCGGIPVIRADKVRDVMTGSITGTVVYSEHLGKVDLLVVDDICDGGGTFIPLAAELRKITTGTVNLLVTHGIFTKGVDIMQGVFDNIFVINNMYGPHSLIQEI